MASITACYSAQEFHLDIIDMFVCDVNTETNMAKQKSEKEKLNVCSNTFLGCVFFFVVFYGLGSHGIHHHHSNHHLGEYVVLFPCILSNVLNHMTPKQVLPGFFKKRVPHITMAWLPITKVGFRYLKWRNPHLCKQYYDTAYVRETPPPKTAL